MPDLVNPYELAADPRTLTPPEAKEFEDLSNRQYPTLTAVSVGLTAAWVFYRKVIRRRLLEEVAKDPNLDPSKLRSILSILYHAYIPSWLGVATPAAVSGYRIGAVEAAAGVVPEEYLQDIAEGYVRQLGEHLNEVSTEAVLEGFHAQLNRKHPASRAAQQVAKAYGVPPRAMNTLVSVWNTEDPKRLVNQPVEDFRDSRAVRVIEDALHLRDHQIGEVEAWNAKTSAKQIVWMYKQQEGIIPRNAKRTWITARDEKVCPSCGPLNRTSVPIGEKFKKGVWTPPLHVNCRCDVVLDFRPNDIDEGLAELFEYQEVGKAMGKDMYDRDKNGRFAPVERRSATKVQTLWDTVNAPSITEDIQRQLQELNKPAPGPIKPIPSLKAIPSTAIPTRAIPSGAIPTAAQSAVPKQEIKREAITTSPILRTLIPAVRQQMIETIDAVIDYARSVPEHVPFGWEEAEFPIAYLIDPEEYGDTGTVWISPNEHGVLLGHDKGRHGGHIAIAHQVAGYWDNKEREIYDQLVEENVNGGVEDEHTPWFSFEGKLYNVEEDMVEEAIAESVYQVIPEMSHSIKLTANDGTEHPFSVHQIAQRLGIDEMVEAARPFVVITNYVNKEQFQQHGAKVSNPGKFKVDIHVDDVFEVGGASNLPTRVRYVTPMD